MESCHIGLIGLAVMGQNLVLNLESRGMKVAVYNRTAAKTREFVDEQAGKNIVAAESITEFVSFLERPRKIILMVKAGEAVDRFLEELVEHLDTGDVVADGGNSHYSDTDRRTDEMEKRGIYYLGTGISGGEEGALKGPSIMIGGPEEGHRLMEEAFTSIAAKVDGGPCAAWLGPGGSGHLVKMVHNGIEYAIMQAIAEAYHFLKRAGFANDELAELFHDYNRGELNSFLVEITAHIFNNKDPETGKGMVDVILDQAGQKGTGKWTVETALEAAVPVPTISAAVEARGLSARRELRQKAARLIGPPEKSVDMPDKNRAKEMTEEALFVSMVCAFAQGLSLLQEKGGRDWYPIPLSTVAAIWRGGCIIRARLLDTIRNAFLQDPKLDNLLLCPELHERINKAREGLAEFIGFAVKSGTPVPAMSASLAYFDGLGSSRLPANLIQAQRDYFGAHTFTRIDGDGLFHHNWNRS